jgi:hypothetical protein
MKLSAMILTAAFIASMPALAVAQSSSGGAGTAGGVGVSGGGGGVGNAGGTTGAGGDPAGGPHRLGRGADANPTGAGANPALGNSAAPPTARGGGRADNLRWGGSDSSRMRMRQRPVRMYRHHRRVTRDF